MDLELRSPERGGGQKLGQIAGTSGLPVPFFGRHDDDGRAASARDRLRSVRLRPTDQLAELGLRLRDAPTVRAHHRTSRLRVMLVIVVIYGHRRKGSALVSNTPCAPCAGSIRRAGRAGRVLDSFGGPRSADVDP